jgi:hypothetical protein
MRLMMVLFSPYTPPNNKVAEKPRYIQQIQEFINPGAPPR